MRLKSAVVVVAVLVAAQAYAHAQTALKAADNVNVRTGPGTGYAIMGTVPAGQCYVGITKSDGWWKIYYDGRTGWTHGSYWSTLSGQTGVKVNVDVLNVRSGPSTGYSILGKIYMGQVYYWTTSSGGWYKIYWGARTGWVAGSYVTKVSLLGGSSSTTTTTTSSSTTNLNMYHHYQVTGYFCGPTSAQMVVQYISGNLYSQWTIASYAGTSSSTGTSNYNVVRSINHFGGSSYVSAGYSGTRVRNNIGARKPCNMNMQMHYIAYTNYHWAMHHSPAKGYTSGGFYIHDSAWGPNQWVSSTQLYNAVVYHYNLTGVRYY